MRRILLLLGLFQMAGSYAQYNLVPNYSFEDYNNCPTGISGFDWYVDAFVNDWYTAGGGTSDYFNSCAAGGTMVSVPANLFTDDQPAHTGNAYGGFWTDLYDNNSFIYREYTQIQLISTLEAGKCYYVEFWSAPATKSDFAGIDHATTDAIGAYFSNDKVGAAGISDVLPYTPQVDNNGSGNYIDTPGSWTKICGFFEAAGGENWICIGNYHPDDEVTCVAYAGGVLDATPLVYLFLDDVLVTPVDSLLHLPDTIVCSPFELQAPTCADSYLWSTGETASSITVHESGDYWLQLSTPCGVVSDTAHVIFVEDSVYTSHSEDTICFNAFPYTITASPTYDYYLWNTGATGESIDADAAGTYYVTGFADCATFIDSFTVTAIPPVGTFPDLGNDTLICADPWSITLHGPSGFDTYTWSTGDTSKNIDVNNAGTYWLLVENTCESLSDTISITEDPYLNAHIDLGEDIVLCPPANINEAVIIVPINLPNYLWNTGSTENQITVTAPGTYIVTSDLLCNDPSDTIVVTFCDDIAVPNAFSPNNDGVNDVLSVITIDPSRIITFRIYNRWGELVYNGNASNYSWDGTFNGKAQPLGSYVYVLNFHTDNGDAVLQGNITLVR